MKRAKATLQTEIICLGRPEALKSLGTAQCDFNARIKFSLQKPHLVQFSSFFKPQSNPTVLGWIPPKARVRSAFAFWSATFDCARTLVLKFPCDVHFDCAGSCKMRATLGSCWKVYFYRPPVLFLKYVRFSGQNVGGRGSR